jgi:hypothetical protein
MDQRHSTTANHQRDTHQHERVRYVFVQGSDGLPMVIRVEKQRSLRAANSEASGYCIGASCGHKQQYTTERS